MNRTSSYLIGFILGMIVAGSALIGHADHWISGGPGLVLSIFGGLTVMFVIVLTAFDENKNQLSR